MGYDFSVIQHNLEVKGYNVVVCKNKEEASDYLNKHIDNQSVGFGGSMSIEAMQLYETLSLHNTVYTHARQYENMTMDDIRRAACQSDIYISSVNGISMNGDIVNIDNTGNRVAAIQYGPKHVYLIVGKNKIADDLHKAIYRAQNIAAPKNAQRLNRKTPCALKGDRCYQCQSEDKICRILSVLTDKPAGALYTIVFVDEDLGY